MAPLMMTPRGTFDFYDEVATISSSSMQPLHLAMASTQESSHQMTKSSEAVQRAPQDKCKRVAFAEQVKVRDTVHFNDYSIEEKRATWYSGRELKVIRNQAKILAKSDLGASCCLRGLEAKTPGGANRKRLNRTEARAVVLLEQDMQECEGISDPDAVANVYKMYSAPCQIEAQMIAAEDERDAKEVYESFLKECSWDFSLGGLVVSDVATGSPAA